MEERRVPRLPKAPKRESAVDLVINGIKQMLVAGRVKPGGRLPNEMEVASALSVSRGSVREAMKILAAFGIVDILQGDGTYVATSMKKSFFGPLFFSLIASKGDAEKLVELREMIELGIVRIIARNADEEDLREIERQYEALRRQIEGGERDAKVLAPCDIEFHRSLGRATKNELIEKIYGFLIEYFAPSIEKVHREKTSRLAALRLHGEIAAALRARDVARAERAIESYDQGWARLLTKVPRQTARRSQSTSRGKG